MEQDFFAGTLGMIILFIMLIAAILWFFLPFAVFGTKPRIDELIQTNKKTNALLESINGELIKQQKASNVEDMFLKNSQEDQEKT